VFGLSSLHQSEAQLSNTKPEKLYNEKHKKANKKTPTDILVGFKINYNLPIQLGF